MKYNQKEPRSPSVNFAELCTPTGFKICPQGHVPILLDRNDPINQIQGLEKRLLQRLPTPNHYVVAEFKQHVAQWLRRHMTPLNSVPSFQEWIEAAPYPEHRKVELRRVYHDLHGSWPTKAQRQKVSSFPKLESYEEYKYLRWINSRCDAVKVTVGPAFHAIEQVLFAKPWFAKRFKAPGELAEHIATAPRALHWASSDYTAFESHMTPEMMDACELQLYEFMLQCHPRLARFIRATIAGTNRLSTRAGVSVKVHGRRMSGDMCTSLGNSFLNLMVATFVAAKSGDPDPWVIVEGDDGLTGTKVPVDESWFQKLGLIIKWKSEENPCEAGFCGKVFGPSRQVIRDPRRVIQTFGWSDRAVNAPAKVRAELLRAKALSLAYETPHCPIVRAVADLALERTRGYTPRYVVDSYHQAGPKDESNLPPFAPTADTRALFAKKYGITVQAQLDYEGRIRSGDTDVLTYLFWPTQHQLFQETHGVRAVG